MQRRPGNDYYSIPASVHALANWRPLSLLVTADDAVSEAHDDLDKKDIKGPWVERRVWKTNYKLPFVSSVFRGLTYRLSSQFSDTGSQLNAMHPQFTPKHTIVTFRHNILTCIIYAFFVPSEALMGSPGFPKA